MSLEMGVHPEDNFNSGASVVGTEMLIKPKVPQPPLGVTLPKSGEVRDILAGIDKEMGDAVRSGVLRLPISPKSSGGGGQGISQTPDKEKVSIPDEEYPW